ncbi:MAG TPA: lipopolysaccharide transport periplasmic protein LptA [Beijerinckiaceae bacterium]|jgi:lipopolysaccharide export system protein LptA|nr:lipopolysaccharide transport periplasmic protein LptA [Beijerinckiaceae bacterium]
MSARGLVLTLALVAAGAAPAFAQKSTAVLPGASSKEPVSIDAGKLDYFDKDQKLVYSGAVVATQGESRLKASVLTIFLEPAPANSNDHQMRRMEAQGPVTITAKDQIGTGDSGVYDRAENKVFLTGHVTLSQGANVTKGERLVYDLNTNQAVVLGGASAQGGRVRSVFTPGEKPGPAPNGSQSHAPAPQKPRATRADAAAQAD